MAWVVVDSQDLVIYEAESEDDAKLWVKDHGGWVKETDS